MSSHQKNADSCSKANHKPAWHETVCHQLCWSNLWVDRGKVYGYLSMYSENFCKDTFNVTILKSNNETIDISNNLEIILNLKDNF